MSTHHQKPNYWLLLGIIAAMFILSYKCEGQCITTYSLVVEGEQTAGINYVWNPLASITIHYGGQHNLPKQAELIAFISQQEMFMFPVDTVVTNGPVTIWKLQGPYYDNAIIMRGSAVGVFFQNRLVEFRLVKTETGGCY